ncbi:uncharacterized protein ACNS7B_017513 isoform 1-T1 [Menidia menidia]
MKWLSILSFFPLFCVSMAASCTSTRTPGGTEYVLDASCPPHCDHSWSNSTGHVIANAKDEAEQVLDQNSSRLHIRDCDDVTLSCHCFPDGELYNATCVGNCTKAAGQTQEEGTPPNHWIIPLIVLVLFLVLIVVGVFVSKRRKKNQGTLPSQTSGPC